MLEFTLYTEFVITPVRICQHQCKVSRGNNNLVLSARLPGHFKFKGRLVTFVPTVFNSCKCIETFNGPMVYYH